MLEWVLGISVWILLVIAVYLFFRNKFENLGELFGEDAEDGFEDDYEEAEEFEESEDSVWIEEYEGTWDESSGNEGAWEESSGNERAWEESSGNEGAWEESSENESAWEESSGNEGAGNESAWDESFGNGSYMYERAWEESSGNEGAGNESFENEVAWEESSGNGRTCDENYGNGSSWEEDSWSEEAQEDPQVYYLEELLPVKRAQAARDGRHVGNGKTKQRREEKRNPGALGRLAIPLILIGMVYLLLPYYCVRREITIDAGDKCPGVEAFLNWDNKKASIVSEINENTVLDRVGDYGIIIEVYGRKVASVLHVEGTAEPYIATKNVAIFRGESVRANDFVEEVGGITPVDIRFAKEPDCETGGINTVLLEIEDEVGNVTTAEALLEVIADTEPPVIHGVSELTMMVGGSISYKKGVTVTDNYDQDVKLNVDSSAVNVDKAGDYSVIYTAVDSAGNKTSVSTILHVEPMTIDTVTEEGIYAEADKLLEKILTDSMSQYEQAKAIYDWCHSNIAYSDGTPKTNWVQGAYRGLVNRKGDCYVYAATAKCLLSRAGIKNMDIEKIPAKSMHYWNLIDIGEGWRHFDTCRRKDGSTFFYKTDEELMEYSNTHNKSHNYDRNLYPELK